MLEPQAAYKSSKSTKSTKSSEERVGEVGGRGHERDGDWAGGCARRARTGKPCGRKRQCRVGLSSLATYRDTTPCQRPVGTSQRRTLQGGGIGRARWHGPGVSHYCDSRPFAARFKRQGPAVRVHVDAKGAPTAVLNVPEVQSMGENRRSQGWKRLECCQKRGRVGTTRTRARRGSRLRLIRAGRAVCTAPPAASESETAAC